MSYPAGDASESDPTGEWHFLQCFGERTPGEDIQEADIISAVEFDQNGLHLATGDRGGRVVLFERVHPHLRQVGMEQRPPVPRGFAYEYRYMTEFQSHEPEFDYLKSLEIEEKIDKVRWCRSANNARMLLSTNDKTVKLWKVYDKKISNVSAYNADSQRNGPASASTTARSITTPGSNRLAQLRLPKVTSTEVFLASRCKKTYANAHTYHINSISVNSDQETFLSADDLRVNLWNFEVTDQSFNIVDIKPDNMEDLTEVITAAEFHPRECNLFAYSSSKGCIRLADMRDAALCDQHAKAFEEPESQANRSFFSEIIASVSDIKFSHDGRHILSRDYMTLKLWDLRNEKAPVATFHTHEYLRSRLCDLYENDAIFDKFDCCISGRGDAVASGTYNNMFRIFGTAASGGSGGGELTLEASRDPMRKKQQAQAKGTRFRMGKMLGAKKSGGPGGAGDSSNPEFGSDYGSKMLHMAWHPQANVIAAASSNSLYMYCT